MPQLVTIIGLIRAWYFGDSYNHPDAAITAVFPAFVDAELAEIYEASLVKASIDLSRAIFTSSPSLPTSAMRRAQKLYPNSECNVPGIYLHLGRGEDFEGAIYIGYGQGQYDGSTEKGNKAYSGMGGVLKRVICQHGDPGFRLAHPSHHYESLSHDQDTWQERNFALLAYFYDVELQALIKRLPQNDDLIELADSQHRNREYARALIAILESCFIIGGGFVQSESLTKIFAEHNFVPPRHGFKTLNLSPGLEKFSQPRYTLMAKVRTAGQVSAAKLEEAGYPNLNAWMLERFGQDKVTVILKSAGTATRDRRCEKLMDFWNEGHYLSFGLTPAGHPKITYTESTDDAVRDFLPADLRTSLPRQLQLEIAVRGKAKSWVRPTSRSTVWRLLVGDLGQTGLPLAENVRLYGYELLDTSLLDRTNRTAVFLPKSAIVTHPSCLKPLQRCPSEPVVFSLANSRAWDRDPEVKHRKPKEGETDWTYERRFQVFISWLQYCYSLRQIEACDLESGVQEGSGQ